MQKLKLSEETVSVLKNFNQINPNLYVREGNLLTTISPGKTILARYVAPEVFESNFGIYRLDKLLGVLSFFEDPQLQITQNAINVKENGQTAKITFADPSVLEISDKTELKMPTVDATFKVTEEQLTKILRVGSAMSLPFIVFENCNSQVIMRAEDIENPSGDEYSIEVGANKGNGHFKAIFDVTNMKMIPADYKVQLSVSGKIKVACFESTNMTYWIAIHKDSTYNDG